ncbi:MAG: flagellar biosynthetic protein FliO [Candidatus Poribacteria bacterium]
MMKNKYQIIIFFTLIILIIISDLICFGSDITSSDGTENEIASPNYGNFGDSIRMITSLFFVLALIVGGVFLLKKIPLYRRFMLGSRNPVSVITSVSLGHRRSVCVVKVANEMLILGLTNTNISLLSKMDADEFLSYMNTDIIDSYKSDENKTSFLNQLKKFIGNKQQDI